MGTFSSGSYGGGKKRSTQSSRQKSTFDIFEMVVCIHHSGYQREPLGFTLGRWRALWNVGKKQMISDSPLDPRKKMCDAEKGGGFRVRGRPALGLL